MKLTQESKLNMACIDAALNIPPESDHPTVELWTSDRAYKRPVKNSILVAFLNRAVPTFFESAPRRRVRELAERRLALLAPTSLSRTRRLAEPPERDLSANGRARCK